MLTLQIHDIKDFMSKLLISDLFHPFLVREVSITTYNTFHINGHLHKEFYTAEELEIRDPDRQNYSSWEDIRPFCLSLIKGNKSPLKFHLVFSLTTASAKSVLSDAGLPSFIDSVDGMYLNIRYTDQSLFCTTGLSTRTFLPDKRPEHAWDQETLRWFQLQHIPFEQI